jgi:hypothetical protein
MDRLTGAGNFRIQLGWYTEFPLVSLLGMTLSSLNPAIYGFLEARVDFDRSRSTY